MTIKEHLIEKVFKPIKNALLNAASNTATKAINKVADKAASKVKNEDLKNIIDVTRETAQNAKDSIIEQSRGNGKIFTSCHVPYYSTFLFIPLHRSH